MDPCSICGAAHAPAAVGEPCLAACVRALSARVAAIEPKPLALDESTTATVPVVQLGGSAGGSGGMT